MEQFTYVIKNKSGEVIKGVTKAVSEEDLRAEFKAQGFLVFSIAPAKKKDLLEQVSAGPEWQRITAALILLVLVGGAALFLYSKMKNIGAIPEEPDAPMTTDVDTNAGVDVNVLKAEKVSVNISSKVKPKEEPIAVQEKVVRDDVSGETPVVIDLTESIDEDVIRIGGNKVEYHQDVMNDYDDAKRYFREAALTGSKSMFRKAIRSARQVLGKNVSEYMKEEMRSIIERSRDMIRR